MLHIPILRHGQPYRSVDVVRVPHFRTRETFVEISQANAGLIRRDLRDQETGRRALEAFTTDQLIAMCREAAGYFMTASLPVGDAMQSPDDYVEQLSATTGMPHVLVRKNMNKISGVMAEMASVLAGLTRGLETTILEDRKSVV